MAGGTGLSVRRAGQMHDIAGRNRAPVDHQPPLPVDIVCEPLDRATR